MPVRPILLMSAALLGLSAVALGAFGAHALRSKLEALGHFHTWDTAVKYHLAHTLAVLWASTQGDRVKWVKVAAFSWIIGVVLFSGSLYLLSLGGPAWLGPITPLGGLAFMVGWGAVAGSALAKRGQAD